MSAFLMPDISSNNGPPVTADEAKRIARVCKALMVKSTEGVTYRWSGFRASEHNARAAGLKTGAYHFVRDGSGVAQARFMWSVVEDSGVSFLCIDWEDGSRQTALDMLHELRALVRNSGKKLRVGAYEGVWAREHGGGLPGCDFVIVPAYGSSSLPPAYKLKPYAAWQYTNGQSNGTRWPSTIPGIGPCDVSIVERPALLFGDDDATKVRKTKRAARSRKAWAAFRRVVKKRW